MLFSRNCFIVRNHCSDAALQSLAMESLENRRKKHVYRSVTKCMNGKFPQFFYKSFQLQSRYYGTSDAPEQPIAPPSSMDRSGKKVIFFTLARKFLIILKICSLNYFISVLIYIFFFL